MQKDFAFQHVERLVSVGVPMQQGHLPGLKIIFEDQERTAGSSAVGIEALIWLTDVAGLTRAQAAQLMQWSAQALLNEAVSHGLPPE